MNLSRCNLHCCHGTKSSLLVSGCTWFSYGLIQDVEQSIDTLFTYKAMIMKQQFLSKQINKIDAFGNDVYDI